MNIPEELRTILMSMGMDEASIPQFLTTREGQIAMTQVRQSMNKVAAQDIANMKIRESLTNKLDPNSVIAEIEAVKGRIAEEKKKIPNKPVPHPLLRQSLLRTAAAERTANVGEGAILGVLKTFSGIEKSYSNKDLKHLKRASLSDLYVHKVNRGIYLLARIISTPYRKLGVTVALEDPSGRAEQISIYNYPLNNARTGQLLDDIFPLGAILAIREPNYKMAASGPSTLIRVDSPTDIIFLHPLDPLVKDVKWSRTNPARELPLSADFKQLGNDLFKDERYHASITMYTKGIDSGISSSPRLLLYLNRAAAHLELKNYISAHSDMESVQELLKVEKDVVPALVAKILFRRAKVLEGLRLFSDAHLAYGDLVAHSPGHVEGTNGLLRMNRRLKESRNAEYDWVSIFKAGTDFKTENRMNVANFVGPIQVQAMTTRGGGRGIIATRDIAVGELLAVENAFAIAYPHLGKGAEIMSFNVATNVLDSTTSVDLVANITSTIMANPQLSHALDSLYAGSTFSSPSPFDLSTFNSPSKPIINDTTAPTLNLSTDRIEGITSCNAFNGIVNEYGTFTLKPKPLPGLEGTNSLQILCSFFNHSCLPNANWQLSSDVMIIRARKPISKGSEIFLAYTSPSSKFEKREILLANHLEKGCKCELCQIDSKDGSAKRLKRYQTHSQLEPMHQLATNGPIASSTVRRLQNYVTNCEAAYAGTPFSLQFLMYDAYHSMSTYYLRHDAGLEKGLEYSLKAINCIGAKIDRINGLKGVYELKICELGYGDSIVIVMLLISIASLLKVQYDKDQEGRVWLQAAIEVESMHHGGGRDLFLMRYEKVLKTLRFYEFARDLPRYIEGS